MRRPEACASASASCPEYGRIVRDQVRLDRLFREKNAARQEAERSVSTAFDNALSAQSKASDFSMKLQALALVYQDKLTSGTLLYELLSLGPFLILLLVFELIPAFAKIFFPASAYDHLVAKEDFYHQLSATVPKTDKVKSLIDSHFASDPETPSIGKLRELDQLEKEKDDEHKVALERVLDKLTEFFRSLVATLGIALTSLLAVFLVVAFMTAIFGTLAQIGSLFHPLFDFGSYYGLLKRAFD